MPSCIVLVNGARAWCLNAVFRCISQEVLAVFGAWAGPARRSERTGRGQDQPYPVACMVMANGNGGRHAS